MDSTVSKADQEAYDRAWNANHLGEHRCGLPTGAECQQAGLQQGRVLVRISPAQKFEDRIKGV